MAIDRRDGRHGRSRGNLDTLTIIPLCSRATRHP